MLVFFWNNIAYIHAIFVLDFIGNNIHIFMWEKIAYCVRLHWKVLLVQSLKKKTCICMLYYISVIERKLVFACSLVLSIPLGRHFWNLCALLCKNSFGKTLLESICICMHGNNICYVRFPCMHKIINLRISYFD